MLIVVDYGVGNLFSLESALRTLGVSYQRSADPALIRSADRLLLPGVGAFAPAMQRLKENGLDLLLREEAARGKEILGICLGMQLLFDEGCEDGVHDGLGLIPGRVIALTDSIPSTLKTPQMGWNALNFRQDRERHPLFRELNEGDQCYFVHSYHAVTDPQYVIATCDYGTKITAAVAKGNVQGCQFHPEKSAEVGLAILKSFCSGRERSLR